MIDEQKQVFEQIKDLLGANDTGALSEMLADARSSDIAEFVEALDNEQRRVIFDILDKHTFADVLEKVTEAIRDEIYDMLGQRELTALISELDSDDAADLLLELPDDEVQQVLDGIEPVESAKIRDLMSYSEDSAGGIMDPVLISVFEDATVSQAINKIRAATIDEDFFSVFVTNNKGRFVGNVRVRLLLTSPEGTQIKELMDSDPIYVSVEADQEEVRNIFSKNDLIVVPVLSKHHKLVGRITADRVIEVAEEEAAEDLYAMAGTDADELDRVSSVHAARVRMTWLLPCLGGTAVTAVVLLLFKNIFIEAHLLPIYLTAFAFAPMIAAISGNAGLQTSAIVVCGLATGHLAALKIGQVFFREVRIALLVALSCGVVGALVCAFLPNLINSQGLEQVPQLNLEASLAYSSHLRIVFAFGIAMFSAIMVATTLGLMLPFLFRRIGFDPAISSGPLVTTANDAISVAIYMSLTLLLV